MTRNKTFIISWTAHDTRGQSVWFGVSQDAAARAFKRATGATITNIIRTKD